MQLGLGVVSIEEIFISVTAISASYLSIFWELPVYAPICEQSSAEPCPRLVGATRTCTFHPPNLDGVSGRHHMKWRGKIIGSHRYRLGSEEALWNGDIRIQAEFVSIILGVAV